MKPFGIAVIWGLGGYLVGAFGGGWAVSQFSSNVHDRSVEAAMTGAFFLGPALAIVAFVAALVWRRSAQKSNRG